MSLYTLLNISDWRYERKFAISNSNKPEVETIVKLHPAMFREVFYERQVNNLYFDTLDMDNYNDNVVGAKERLKVRIRWYGDMFGMIEAPVLEIKCKNGLLGGKAQFTLPSFVLDENISLGLFDPLFTQLPEDVSAIKQCLLSLKCTLLNSYSRKYFLSVDGKYRLTIDSNLDYFRILNSKNSFLNKYTDKLNIILELKYKDNNDKLATMISANFPFLITKSSKYVNGIDFLYE